MRRTDLRALLRAVLVTAAVPLFSGCGSSNPAGAQERADPLATPAPDYQETWSGGPFVASNPLVNEPPLRSCPDAGSDPVCHYHRIAPPANVRHVMVAIRPAEGFETDDYDLWVYDDRNTLVAANADGDGDESVVFPHSGAPYYDVRVQPYTVSPGSGYQGMAKAVDKSFDVEPMCETNALSGETVPDQAGVAGVTDDGATVELSVLLLLDGTDFSAARAIMARAADAYRPLGIELVLAGTQAVAIEATESQAIIDQAKALMGGAPPSGVDVVGVLTDQEMQSSTPGTTVIGQADCIGGIRARYNSFFVATDVRADEAFDLGGFFLNTDMAAETVAHEIGHVLGAHHHYGNCVEGNLNSGGPGDVSPCTLMFPLVNGASLDFGLLEGATVRGHAVEYAQP